MNNKFKNRIRFDDAKKDIGSIPKWGNGVCIWVDGRGVMDASCFTRDGELIIDTERMKIVRNDKVSHKIVFRFDRRFKR